MTASTLVEPAYLWMPPYTRTLGPEVADICALAGYEPDAEQCLLLDGIFALGENGRALTLEAAVVAPRQNIKTSALKMAVLGWLFVTDQQLITWSAHEFDIAQEAHRDLSALLEDTPALSRRLKKITRANGDEGIELKSGQRVRFKARTNTAGRGLSGDKMVLDEAFALRPSHMGSLFPTLSARSDPQICYGSSAGQVSSGVLRSIRDRGRKGGDSGLMYAEWCDDLPGDCASSTCTHAYGSAGCRLDDEVRWHRANSTLGHRISVEFLRQERKAIPAQEFAREVMVWWDDPPGDSEAIDLTAWADCCDETSTAGSQLAFGIDVTPDRRYACIAVASLRHVEVVEHRPGTRWVAARYAELRAKWAPDAAVVVHKTGPAGSLAADLPGVIELATSDVAQACAQFYDDVSARAVRHLGQGELDTAMRGADRQLQGDSFIWSRRKSDVDISPLYAVTLARAGLKRSAPSPYETRGIRVLG